MRDGFVKVTHIQEEKDFSINSKPTSEQVALESAQLKATIQSKLDEVAVKLMNLRRLGVSELEISSITNRVNQLFLRMNDDIEELKQVVAEIDSIIIGTSNNVVAVGLDESYVSKRAM